MSTVDDGSRFEPTETPFIVYAVDAPTYPARLLGGMYPNSGAKPDFEVTGSTVAISAGYMRPDAVMGQDFPIIQTCTLNTPVDTRFWERAVASLVEPEDRVMLCFDRRISDITDEIRAKFEIIKTKDDALCVGNGSQLIGTEWLDRHSQCGMLFIASSRCESPLEITLMECVRRKTHSISQVWQVFWAEVEQDPQNALRDLRGYSVLAGFSDPDNGCMVINRSRTSIARIEGDFADIAKGLGVDLYCAGSVTEPDERGRSFGDFDSWLSWSPMPGHWRRVAW